MASSASSSSAPAPPVPAVRLSVFETAVTSALSGVLSSAVVYPMDTVKTRLQADAVDDSLRHAPGKLARVMRRRLPLLYGILVHLRHAQFGKLYKGFGANMLTTFFMQFCYFYWYTLLRANYVRRFKGLTKGTRRVPLSTLAELSLGAIAGALAQLFILPMSIVATRQQVAHKPRSPKSQPPQTRAPEKAKTANGTSTGPTSSSGGDDGDPSDDHSFLAVAKEVYAENGVSGFWSGLKPSLILCINPALTYGAFERMKTVVLNASGSDRLSPGQSFWIGAASKTVATVVTFPFILAKVRLQARSRAPPASSAGTPPPSGDSNSLRAIMWELTHGPEGLRGSYRGMEAHIHKTVLSQSLLFVARDFFEVGATALLQLKARRAARNLG